MVYRHLKFAALGLCGTLAACETPEAPPPPLSPPPVRNSVLISKPFDQAWAEAIPAVSRSFFVINNVAKDSGLINLTYSGSPEGMVRCQWLGFAPNVPSQLEGRMNIVFQKITDDDTRITVNVRYQLTAGQTVEQQTDLFDSQQVMQSAKTQFNTNQVGGFDPTSVAAGSQCVATGDLERQILETVAPGGAVQAGAGAMPSSREAADAARLQEAVARKKAMDAGAAIGAQPVPAGK
jgi:hypothetical protein